jgi:MFS superfamily sulfate permease-like transporter/mannitol/fructose-specific phosphotransferase system IIA component (Ntr-type)
VAPAVIDGMLAGIGVLIFAAQFHVMVDDVPKGTGLDNLLSIPSAVVKGLLPMDRSVHHLAAMIGVLTLVILVAMRSFARGALRHVPPALVAVGFSTLVVSAVGLPIRMVDMPASFVEALQFPSTAALSLLLEPSIWVSALAFAFVASAETLLCATAVDALHEGDRTNYDRELFAQGVGNVACGLLGAPPMTGAITRSTANAQAGATSPASAIMVSTWMLAVLVLFPSALQILPRASLAGLLVYVGYKLVKTRPLRELRWYGKSELAIFGTTLVVIVTMNLLTGIVVGLLMAAGKLLYSRGASFHRLEIELVQEPEARRTHLHLRGSASFFRLPRLAVALEALPMDQEIHLHVENLEYIDHACLDLLEKWEGGRTRARAPVRVLWSHLRHQYHLGNRLDATPDEHLERPNSDVRLMDFLTPECILIEPDLRDRSQALEVLAAHLAEVDPTVDSAQHIRDSAEHREHEASTYMGSGLMIPHARLNGPGNLHGVLALSRRGWRWGSLDAEPLHGILLLQTPESQATRHLAIVAGFARIFALAPELRARLLASDTPQQAYEVLTGPDAASVNTVVESGHRGVDEPTNAAQTS